jgi:hypothetical protein
MTEKTMKTAGKGKRRPLRANRISRTLGFRQILALNGKPVRALREKESSSAFFQKLRPKFLDWRPPTEEEKALEVKARREAKEAELKKVTELAMAREAEKAAMRKRYRSAATGNKRRERR